MVSARRPLSQIDKLDNVQKGPSTYAHVHKAYAITVAAVVSALCIDDALYVAVSRR